MAKNIVSSSVRAGLHIPVGRLGTQLRAGHYASRVGATSPVFLAGVLEHVAARLLKLGADTAGKNKRTRIMPRDIKACAPKVLEHATIPGTKVRVHQAKRSGKHVRSYRTHLLKLLKAVDKDASISRDAMDIMNYVVADLFHKVASEAASLTRHARQQTLTAASIEAAVKLVLPHDLVKLAIAQGKKAVTKFNSSA